MYSRRTIWSTYTVCIKDGSTWVLITDVTCLKDINAEAVLKLQAGFRPYYARDIYANEKSFLECLLEAIDSRVSDIYSELGIMRIDLKDKQDALFQDVTGSRMNCQVTTVEGIPSSTGLNSS